MKNILLIGVGGTGSSAVDILYQKIREFGNQTNNKISAVVFDTDLGCVNGITSAQKISMADTAGVGTICDRLGNDIISEWFPCDNNSVRAQEMVRGASQWRKKSYLAFLNAMNKQSSYSAFTRALEALANDSNAACEVYVIASIAGGTGSGSFIPIALFAKQYLKSIGKDAIVNAMVALPDIYAESQSPDNRIKIFANAYAILRELNAINQVARGYNREVFDNNRMTKGKKKSPIRLRIGSKRAKEEKNQNVGLLFDSMDENFWTPEAAPFSQVFLLDRIPGIHSIRAHDIILANSLYTVLCTDIGAEFDSEYSNHVTLVSQKNGSNAIYAGISTSQLCFPKETILEYLAHEKTMQVCEEEWLVLHRATEETIREKEALFKELRRHFTLGDGDYAKYYLAELENQRDLSTSAVCEIVDRTTALYDEDGKMLPKNTADTYFETISNAIADKVAHNEDLDKNVYLASFKNMMVTKRPRFSAKRELRSKVVARHSEIMNSLTGYYISCVEFVRDSLTPVSDLILTFNKNKDIHANEELSLVDNLLMKDGKYVHPITAMTQLCRLKKRLVEHLASDKNLEWNKINTKADVELPLQYKSGDASLPVSDGEIRYESRFKPAKSLYMKAQDRFATFPLRSTSRTDAYTDNALLIADGMANLNAIYSDAVRQLQYTVFLKLSSYLDSLIERYREFFSHFEEAKLELAEATKMARRKDSGKTDSVLNILSSEKEKEIILRETLGQYVEDENDIKNNDDVAGESVFHRCYLEAAVEVTGDITRTENLPDFSRLFTRMIKSYGETIRKKNNAFKNLARLDVFQAILESCRKLGKPGAYETAIKDALTSVLEIARPSLVINSGACADDSPIPQDKMVVMLSEETARHLKYDADKYGLSVPTEGISEAHVLATCASQFIDKYTGDGGIRVAVVKDIPDNILYFTGEKMDVTPLRIAKFNEMSKDPVYYNNYRRALEFSERYDTDMWNPHLGYNLHKRGYLPYMNEAMEDLCDEKLFKALFFGIDQDKIFFKKAKGSIPDAFWYLDAGTERMVIGSDGNVVNTKNVAQLISWLRNRDDFVDDWSRLFDEWIEVQARSLPNVVVESQRAQLKAQITSSPFITMLHRSFFADKAQKNSDKKSGMGLIEFAWTVKVSEESLRDCDDAERILRVADKIFFDFCAYRAKPDVTPAGFTEVYCHEIEKLFLSLANGTTLDQSTTEEEAIQLFRAIVSWVNDMGFFMSVPEENMLDARGKLRVDAYFENTKAMKTVEDTIRKKFADKAQLKKEQEAQKKAEQNTADIE